GLDSPGRVWMILGRTECVQQAWNRHRPISREDHVLRAFSEASASSPLFPGESTVSLVGIRRRQRFCRLATFRSGSRLGPSTQLSFEHLCLIRFSSSNHLRITLLPVLTLTR